MSSCNVDDRHNTAGSPQIVAANNIAETTRSDVFLFSGPIERATSLAVSKLVSGRKKEPNVIVVMSTYGGDPDAAYVVAKCFQCNYDRFSLFVPGYCKSAGTLVAIGAHEVIFSKYGELGPLDIQIPKKDELGGQESGSAVDNAVDSLMTKSFSAFEKFFLLLIKRSRGQITIPTAAKIAKDLCVGLLSPISQQINPVYLGEVGRALNIAFHYGQMLDKTSMNLQDGALDRLISSYPSHSFVIDGHEAQSLFKKVEFCEDFEERLQAAFRGLGEAYFAPSQVPVIKFLSSESSVASVGDVGVINEPRPVQ